MPYGDDRYSELLAEQRAAEDEQREREGFEREALHTRKADRWRLNRDRWISTLTVTAVLLMVVQNIVVFWKAGSEVVQVNGVETLKPRPWVMAEDFTLAMEVAIGVLSLATLALTAQYYRLLLRLKKREWANNTLKARTGFQAIVVAATDARQQQRAAAAANSYGFFKSSLFPKFVVECFIHLLFPYPFIDHTSAWYKCLQLLMFMRLYVLLRVLHVGSTAYRKRTRISAYYADFRRMNLKIRWSLTFKMLFYKHAVTGVTVMLLGSLLIGGFCIYVLEKDEDPVFNSPGGCIWFAFITFSTIGYGDMVPKTPGGQVVAVLTGIAGHVVAALFGGILTNKLAPSRTQSMISVFLDNQTAEKEFQAAAATLIQSVWRETRKSEQDIKLAKAKTQRNGGAAASAAIGSPRDRDTNSFAKTGIRFIREHKRNKVYAAVKKFRNRRYKVAKAQLQAADPVLEKKLNNLQDAVLLILDRLGLDDGSDAGPRTPVFLNNARPRKARSPVSFNNYSTAISPVGSPTHRLQGNERLRGNDSPRLLPQVASFRRLKSRVRGGSERKLAFGSRDQRNVSRNGSLVSTSRSDTASRIRSFLGAGFAPPPGKPVRAIESTEVASEGTSGDLDDALASATVNMLPSPAPSQPQPLRPSATAAPLAAPARGSGSRQVAAATAETPTGSAAARPHLLLASMEPLHPSSLPRPPAPAVPMAPAVVLDEEEVPLSEPASSMNATPKFRRPGIAPRPQPVSL